MLEHLILWPTGGWGNRIRAMASARRVCALAGARCTVWWTWADYDRFWRPDELADWTPSPSAEVQAEYFRVKHLTMALGGSNRNRRVPTKKQRGIIVSSGYVFNGLEEKRLIQEPELAPWLPQPAEGIMKKVRAFKKAHFSKTAGMHIRRADNRCAIEATPDELYLAEAEWLIARGYDLFLATDNQATVRMMRKRFGKKIIVRPKHPELEVRHPRPAFNLAATIDDFVDFHLLAACDFVVGSAKSSFSRLAMLYNGSKRCKALEREPARGKER